MIEQRTTVASATAFGVAVLLAVVFGAQTEDWSWGPAMLGLGVATAFASREPSEPLRLSVLLAALGLAAGWIFLRAFQSPVIDGARADVLLVACLVSAAFVTSRLASAGRELRWLYLGLAVAALANVGLALAQIKFPELVWPYASKPSPNPTGFFGHYNYFSNFVGGVGVICLCRAVIVKDPAFFRWIFALSFLGALVLVPLSGSRGGTASLGVGLFLFLVCAGVLAWRQKARWAPVFLVALPLVLIASLVGGWIVFKAVNDQRHASLPAGNPLGFVDNLARLQWLELATKVSGAHPIQGGGSRSFSWERNEAWDVESMGRGTENERFVHNELAQTITDYGLIGALLVVAAVSAMMWVAVKHLFLGGRGSEQNSDAMAAAVVAGGGMILIHSNFSFVFHLLPSTILLGVLFGFAIHLQADGRGHAETLPRRRSSWGWLWALPLLAFGFLGTLTLRSVWPVLYAEGTDQRLPTDQQIDRLAAGLKWWPGYRLSEEQGRIARLQAVREKENVEANRMWNSRAAESFAAASLAHPFHPGFQVNLGNILSDLDQDDDAENAFTKAIELQGGLESAFRSRVCYAQHLYRKWYQVWREERRAGEALHEFLRARELLDESDAQSLYGYEDSKALRASLDQVIEFLEGGKVVPVDPAGSR